MRRVGWLESFCQEVKLPLWDVQSVSMAFRACFSTMARQRLVRVPVLAAPLVRLSAAQHVLGERRAV